MTVTFTINQAGVLPPGTPGVARRDLLPCPPAANIFLTETTGAYATYKWEVISSPVGAVPILTDATTQICQLTTFVTGGYLVRLTVDDTLVSEDTMVLYLGIPLAGSGENLPAWNESNQDNSIAPFDGSQGWWEKMESWVKWADNMVAITSAYPPDAVIIIQHGATAVDNGVLLLAGYAAATGFTPGGAALSATNRALVILPPGEYDLDGSFLDMDTDFVDVIGFGTGMSIEGSATTWGTQPTIISDDVKVVLTSADDFILKGVRIHQLTNSATQICMAMTSTSDTAILQDVVFMCTAGSDPLALINANRLPAKLNATFIDCYTALGGFIALGDFGGYARNCKAGDGSFGGNANAADGTNVTCSGYVYNCIGGNYCFGGTKGDGDATFSGRAENCKVTGCSFGACYGTGDALCSGILLHCRNAPTVGSYGSSYGGNAVCSGTFFHCTGGKYSFGSVIAKTGTALCSGTFEHCSSSAGSSFGQSYGGIATCSAYLVSCAAGTNSFGCVTNEPTAPGLFSGTAIDCIGRSDNSFGANAADTTMGSVDTAKLVRCQAADNSFGGRGVITGPSVLFDCVGRDGCFGNTLVPQTARLERCHTYSQNTPCGFNGAIIKHCEFRASVGAPVIVNGNGTDLYDCDLYAADFSPCVTALLPTTFNMAHCRSNTAEDITTTNLIGVGYNVVSPAYTL